MEIAEMINSTHACSSRIHDSLECQCENYKKKCYSVCDICSENKFLRQSSEPQLDSSSSSFSDD